MKTGSGKSTSSPHDLRNNNERGFALWKVRYAMSITGLLVSRCISVPTARMALRKFPIAVAGRGGSYIVS